jgi:hypothetical protein
MRKMNSQNPDPFDSVERKKTICVDGSQWDPSHNAIARQPWKLIDLVRELFSPNQILFTVVASYNYIKRF